MKIFSLDRIRSVRSRILLFIGLLSFIFIIVFSVVFILALRQRDSLKEDYRKQFESSIIVATKTKFAELDKVVYDYTYWDELVEHIALKDTAWARENIQTIPISFHLSRAEIRNLEGSFHLQQRRSQIGYNKAYSRRGVALALQREVSELVCRNFLRTCENIRRYSASYC